MNICIKKVFLGTCIENQEPLRHWYRKHFHDAQPYKAAHLLIFLIKKLTPTPLSWCHSGPFTTLEMCEWFQAGYFTMTLLVKRGCDEGFQPLGDVIKMWGRVPFAPGPSPPPLLVRQPPPPQRPQPNRAPSGTVSYSSD